MLLRGRTNRNIIKRWRTPSTCVLHLQFLRSYGYESLTLSNFSTTMVLILLDLMVSYSSDVCTSGCGGISNLVTYSPTNS